MHNTGLMQINGEKINHFAYLNIFQTYTTSNFRIYPCKTLPSALDMDRIKHSCFRWPEVLCLGFALDLSYCWKDSMSQQIFVWCLMLHNLIFFYKLVVYSALIPFITIVVIVIIIIITILSLHHLLGLIKLGNKVIAVNTELICAREKQNI